MAAIAEAFVRLRPDLTQFRAELQTGVTAAVESIKAPPITVLANVVARSGGTAGVASGLAQVEAASAGAAAGQQNLNRVLASSGTSVSKFNTAVNALIATERRLIAVQEAGRFATSEAAAARAQAIAASAALTRAQRSEALARATGNVLLIEAAAAARTEAAAKVEATTASLGLAAAEKADAAAATQAASSHALAARGAGASALALAGLRGATLAASAQFLAGAAALTLLAKSVKAFADLETELNTFQVVAGATADQMERIGEEARALGRDVTLPGVSAGDAARAMTELAKAGLTVEDALSGARGVLQLSAAANIDVADAAAIAGSALNAFGLAGDKATHVADLLTGASIAAQGEVTDMAQSLEQSATVAAQFGLSVEETAGAIALLAKNGLLGSDAGTSLRTTLLRLVPTSKEAAQTVNGLGIAFQDVSGRTLPLPEIFQNYREALARLTPVQRQAALTTVFGSDAIRAATIFTNAGARGIRDMTEATDRNNAAQDVAAARTKGFAGQLEALKSNAETAAGSLGSVLAPALEGIVGDANDAVDAFNVFADAVRSLGDTEIHVDIGVTDIDTKPLKDLIPILDVLRKVTITPLEAPFLSTKAFKFGVEQLGSENDNLRREIADLKQQSDDLDAIGRRPPPNLDRFFQTFGRQPQFRTGMADAGERLGIAFVGGVAKGIESKEDQAVRQAEATLAKVIREGNLAITQAVEDAKANLFSLGDSLSQQVGQLIDFGPLGQRIKGLEDTLAASQTQDQRQGLINDLREAKIAMREALIDTGPLGDKLKALQEQLARSQSRGTRAGLVADLRDAQAELQKALRAADTGDLRVSPEIRASLDEFLRPRREAVAAARAALEQDRLGNQIEDLTTKITNEKRKLRGDPFVAIRQGITKAETAIKNFNTEQLIGQLRRQAQEEKTVVSKGISDVIFQFNQSRISFAQARQQISRIIANAEGKNSFRAAGNALGAAFVGGFRQNLDDLIEQMQKLALGPQRPGTTGQQGRVVNPQQAVIDLAERRLAAQEKIAEAIRKKQDSIDSNTAATATNTATIARNTAPPGTKKVSK